jgi:hypothetical protein
MKHFWGFFSFSMESIKDFACSFIANYIGKHLVVKGDPGEQKLQSLCLDLVTRKSTISNSLFTGPPTVLL